MSQKTVVVIDLNGNEWETGGDYAYLKNDEVLEIKNDGKILGQFVLTNIIGWCYSDIEPASPTYIKHADGSPDTVLYPVYKPATKVKPHTTWSSERAVG